jgi:hypothetical protein
LTGGTAKHQDPYFIDLRAPHNKLETSVLGSADINMPDTVGF